MFGFKKKNKFYKELPETEVQATTPAVAEAVVEPQTTEVETPVADKASGKTSAKKKAKAAKAPEPAKVEVKTPAKEEAPVVMGETTFAPHYLNPISNNTERRRPGPSMNPFMDIARQMSRR